MLSKGDRWTAIVPLRAGSKGLPNKNTRILAGKPLYSHAIEQALRAGASKVIVSTDIEEIVENVNLPTGVDVIRRPTWLCEDNIPMAPVISHALSETRTTGPVVLLQATSPLRDVTDIEAALSLFATVEYDVVMSVTEADRVALKWGTVSGTRFQPLSDPSHCFSNRQSLPAVFRPNGAIYIFDAEWILARGSFVTDRLGCVAMPPSRSWDIDTVEDFERCAAAFSPSAIPEP
ncbi:MAG: acylneuraminate cytidylyltransferase family protein [Gemmatimonadaceae bacterium]|nr:acylneuraminate cytidylyltransferase family protein [Gemmatimonadaceae bacterium]